VACLSLVTRDREPQIILQSFVALSTIIVYIYFESTFKSHATLASTLIKKLFWMKNHLQHNTRMLLFFQQKKKIFLTHFYNACCSMNWTVSQTATYIGRTESSFHFIFIKRSDLKYVQPAVDSQCCCKKYKIKYLLLKMLPFLYFFIFYFLDKEWKVRNERERDELK
jgi:hypothetical protein